MPRGKVKWFDNRKGWGFVIQPDGTDLFVHYTSIVGDGFRRLDDGCEVEYEVVEGPKGLQAGDVRLVAPPPGATDEPATEAATEPATDATVETETPSVTAPSGDAPPTAD